MSSAQACQGYVALILAIGSVHFLPADARATEINISQQLTANVFEKNGGKVVGQRDFCLSDGTSAFVVFGRQLAKCTLYFDNVQVTTRNVVFLQQKLALLPQSIQVHDYLFANCSATSVLVDDQLTLTTSEGATIRKTTTITVGERASWTTSARVPISGAEIGIARDSEATWSNQESSESTKSMQSDVQTTHRVQLNIPGRSGRQVSLSKTIFKGYIDFKGLVLVEADVQIRYGNLSQANAVAKLSTLLPNPDDRTLALAGQLWLVSSGQMRRVDKVAPASVIARECADLTSGVKLVPQPVNEIAYPAR